MMASLVKTAIGRAFNSFCVTDWLTHTRRQTDFIICPTLLTHWADKHSLLFKTEAVQEWWQSKIMVYHISNTRRNRKQQCFSNIYFINNIILPSLLSMQFHCNPSHTAQRAICRLQTLYSKPGMTDLYTSLSLQPISTTNPNDDSYSNPNPTNSNPKPHLPHFCMKKFAIIANPQLEISILQMM